MKGDFSRLRFNPGNNYTSVLQQQGRVALDADANEQCAINDYLRDTETVDVIGTTGGPVNDEGFAISLNASGDAIEIGKGRYYVNGILCENEHSVCYSDQRYLVDPGQTDAALLGELGGAINVIQVYLEVWRRLVTVLDDPCLREPALDADTTARLQTVWRVVADGLLQTKLLTGTVTLTNNSATVTGTGTSFTTALNANQQVVFASDASQTPYPIQTIGSDTSLTLSKPYLGAPTASTTVSLVETSVEAGGKCCRSMDSGLIPAPDPGKLNAKTAASSDCGCQPIPAAGYLGLENQLYRVEIHQPGNETNATFKWSRENGSVVVAVTSVVGAKVYVDSLGPDTNLGFSPGQWVEIYDDSNLFGTNPNQPGNLYQIECVNAGALIVTMKQTVTLLDPGKNARMRRWDQSGTSAGTNGVSVTTGPTALENGIEIEFSKGEYRPGDYWLIPARTVKGDIEWPPCGSDGRHFQPPRRIEVFRAPLACIQLDIRQNPEPKDCRKKFYPLTDLTPSKATTTCCTYRVGDGCTSFGDFTSIQKAIDKLPPEGGEVCILPGLYYQNVRIIGRRDIVIHGCGWQTRVASRSLDPNDRQLNRTVTAAADIAVNPIAAVFTIAASQHISLRSFAVEAADDEAGILIDGTETALSKDQTGELDRLLVRLRGAFDVTIEDLVIAAATLPAVLAVRVENLRVDRNRIAMKNAASRWSTIYASGTEIHIDRNWVGFQSEANDTDWIPYTVTEDLSGATRGSQASDRAAAKTALHPGGIQIGGPSCDVYVLENQIEGGNRNGITLGSFDVLDTKGGDTGIWVGEAVPSEAGDCDCAATATLLASPNYPATTGYTVVAGGLLSNIQIHRNRIRKTGLCGIGPVGFFDLTVTREIITIVGLNISGNDISSTLRRAIEPTDSTRAWLGYGAICIPDVQNLIVRDNTITDFGAEPGAIVCGIYILLGEMIEISRNHVIETRDWASPIDDAEKVSTVLIRGGIFIQFASPPSIGQFSETTAGASASLANFNPIYEPGLPAVRVEHNVVRVPLNYTLAISGSGPFTITNNQLACGGVVYSNTPQLAQTVLIVNLGTAIEIAVQSGGPSNVYSNAYQPQSALYGASVGDFRDISSGAVLFSNNVCQLEATASQQSEFASVFIFTRDHLIFSNNHCWLDASTFSAFIDAFLLAGSLNVVGNRFQERVGTVVLSGLTVGVANVTGENISTNCLIASGHWVADNNNIAFIDAQVVEPKANSCTRGFAAVLASLGL